MADPAERTKPIVAVNIAEQRVQIDILLDESPSLRPSVGDVVSAVWPRSVTLASTQSQLPRSSFPEACPWSTDQMLDSDFLPD